MITSGQCMLAVLKKFPGFQMTWQEYLKYWEGDTPGLCTDLSEFSEYVISLIQEGIHQDELKEIFCFAEQLMCEGDSIVQEAVATCFLEDLINIASSKRISALSFVHLLGKESKEYCKAWDEFTGVKTDGLW